MKIAVAGICGIAGCDEPASTKKWGLCSKHDTRRKKYGDPLFTKRESSEEKGTVMRVAVYGIALQEAHNVEGWAASCQDADVRLIVDTGSTDDTAARARRAGVTVVEARVIPWRFDMARNTAIACLPDDVDWCVALDLDERLQPGWYEAFAGAPRTATRAHLRYVWNWKPDGTPGLQFWRDFGHRRHNYHWRYPVHEALTYYGPGKETTVELPTARIHHFQNTQHPRREMYLNLLEMTVREDPMADRHSSWLGREYLYAGRAGEAAAELKRHISLPTATWADERAASMHLLSTVEPDNRLHWLTMAEMTAPHRREHKVRLAQYYHAREMWPETLEWAEKALAITKRPFDYLSEDWCWGPAPIEYRAVALWNVGRQEEALAVEREAARLTDDPRVRENIRLMEQALLADHR